MKTLSLSLLLALPAAMPVAAQDVLINRPVCTQLELSVGLRGAECGRLTLQEVAEIRTVQTEM